MKHIQQELVSVGHALNHVFKHPSYLLLAISIAVGITVLAIWLPNISFLRHTAVSSAFTFTEKIDIFWSSLGSLKTNFTLLSRTVTLLIAVLSGINIALFVFYLKTRRKIERSMGTSVLGTVAGLLGVGCTACGSVLLTSIFGIGATASFVGLLPFKGAEFGFLGIIILQTTLSRKKFSHPLHVTYRQNYETETKPSWMDHCNHFDSHRYSYYLCRIKTETGRSYPVSGE
ncbi:MAG: hypothetical protein O2877_00740 [bacterium]|nr:hypothetical protein [bacterium]